MGFGAAFTSAYNRASDTAKQKAAKIATTAKKAVQNAQQTAQQMAAQIQAAATFVAGIKPQDALKRNTIPLSNKIKNAFKKIRNDFNSNKTVKNTLQKCPKPSAGIFKFINDGFNILNNISDEIVNPIIQAFPDNWRNPLKQLYKDTCAQMATRSIISEKFGVAPSESGMRALGEAAGGYTKCQGTSDESLTLVKAGIPTTLQNYPSIEDIAKAVENKKGVIVGLDARHLWRGRALNNPDRLGHAVRITKIERNSEGMVTRLEISDSGTGTIYWISKDHFQDGLNDWDGGRAAITDEPLH